MMAIVFPVNQSVATCAQYLAIGERCEKQVSQISIFGHEWSTGEKSRATGGNWQFSKWQLGM